MTEGGSVLVSQSKCLSHLYLHQPFRQCILNIRLWYFCVISCNYSTVSLQRAEGIVKWRLMQYLDYRMCSLQYNSLHGDCSVTDNLTSFKKHVKVPKAMQNYSEF